MRQKICYLHSIILLILCSCINKNEVIEQPNIPYFQTLKLLLKNTRYRPDLTVVYLRHNPKLWINNPYAKLIFAESLNKIGQYKESMKFGFELSLSSLNEYYKNKNAFILAQNYSTFKNNTTQTRYYLDKAIENNNQYYLFYYGRFEEFQNNYIKSIILYQKALDEKFNKKDYISKAYERVLNKALLYYKNKDLKHYNYIRELIIKNPNISKTKAKIIEKSIKL